MNHYSLRLSPAAAVFTTALFMSHSLGQSVSLNSAVRAGGGTSTSHRLSSVENGAQHETQKRSKLRKGASDADVAELIRSFESGERKHETIQEMLGTLAGDSKPIRWTPANIHGTYKLTQIVSHLQNLDNNFEMIFVHTLPDREHDEDTITNYSSRVHESDIQSIRSSIVFSRIIEGKKDKVRFDENSRAQYFFSASSDPRASAYSMRAPQGSYKIVPVGINSFDPLAMLTTNSHVFDEVGEYQYEVAAGTATFNVTIIPRITDMETLAIEVELRELNSLETYTFVLVYEQL